jgi:hypothetical protein
VQPVVGDAEALGALGLRHVCECLDARLCWRGEEGPLERGQAEARSFSSPFSFSLLPPPLTQGGLSMPTLSFLPSPTHTLYADSFLPSLTHMLHTDSFLPLPHLLESWIRILPAAVLDFFGI